MKKLYEAFVAEISKINIIILPDIGCKRAIRIILPAFLFICIVCSSKVSFAQGPGAAWAYVRLVTLSTPTTLPNYQVKVTLTIAGMGNPYTGVNAAGNDLRFYDYLGNNCPYWIESFTNTGTSVIWVKVVAASPVNPPLKMYYGNAAAPAVSSGTATFDFFDDFTTALAANWSVNATGGSITQSGTNVTLSNTNAGTVSISSAFMPASTSFFLETKHQEAAYFRNRFYAATTLNGGSPLTAIPDYGYFVNGTNAATSALVFYNTFTGSPTVNRNTDYLTRWQITDGSVYNWSTNNYVTGTIVDARTGTLASTVRYISISVTEKAATSTIVDWVRVRKSQSADPTTTVGVQLPNTPVLTSLGSASGCAGSTITINGTNLSGATAVTIGGTAVASILTNTGVQITAVTGSGTTGNVVVTTAGGVSNALAFIVNARPTGVLSGSASICNGGSTDLTITATGTGTLSGTLSDGTAFTGTAPTITITVSPTSATTYTIATLTNGTCTSIPADKTGSATVNVSGRPTGSLGGSTSICNGGSTNLTITATGTGTLSGTLSDGTPFSGTAPNITVSVSPTSATTYTIATLTNGTCTSIATDKTGSTTVNVNARPTGSLSGSTSICNGGSINLTITATGTGTLSGTLSDGTPFSGTAPTITVNVSPTTATTYTIATLTNGTCISIPTDKTGSATVVVNARPTGSLSGSTSVCNGGGTNLTITATGTGTLSGTLSDGTPFSGTAPTITVSVSPTATTTYTIATLTDGTCISIAADKTGSVIVTVNDPVIITGNPGPSTYTACGASTVTYTVTATGSGLTYQWLKDGSPVSNGGTISGATSTTLKITGVQAGDAGNYTVVVSGLLPCTSATSTPAATLIVDQRATFSTQPATPLTICQGDAYTISATAVGTVVTAVWNKGGIFYANAGISGNIYSLTIPGVLPSDAGSYQLILDDGTTGCTASNSTIAVLNISVPSVGGTTSGAANKCSGTNSGAVTLTGQTGNVINWESSPDGTTWTTVSPTNTTASLTYSNLTQTTWYRAIVQSGVCPSNPSTPVVITIFEIPTTSVAGSTQTICTTPAGTTLTANVAVSGTGTWSVSGGPNTSATQFSDVNSPAATFTPAGGAGTYALVWTISNGPCATSASTVNIILNTAPSISVQPVPQTTCAGTAKTFSVSAAGTTPTYQWQYSPDNTTWSNVINGAPTNITYINGTTATLTVTPAVTAVNGTYYYRCIVSVNGCSVLNSNSATLIVSATPTIANAGLTQTICTTTTSTVLAANTPVNGTGTWSITSGPSTLISQFSDINNPVATFTPAGVAGGTYILKWTISNGPCTVSSSSVNIIVNTAPSISSQPAPQTTCAGTSKTFSVTAAGTAPTYQWQYSPDNVAWSNVASATPANITYSNGTTATLTVTPAGAAANGIYYYRCAVTVAGCSVSTSNSATLTVSATPTTASAGASQTICTTTTSTTLTANTPANGVGTWSITSGPSPLLTQFSDVNSPTATFTPSGGAGTYLLKWTISNGPCTSSSSGVNIIVNTAPSISIQPVNQTMCAAGTAKTFSVTAAGTSPTYQWQYSPDNSTWSNVSPGTPVNVFYSGNSSSTLSVTTGNGATNGTYYYRCIVSVTGCSVLNSSSATFTVYAKPTTSNTGSNQIICTTTASTILSGNTPVNGTGTWSITGGPSSLLTQFSNINNPTATFTPAGGTGQYSLLWTIANGSCASTSDDLQIFVNTAPTITGQPANQTACAGVTPSKTFSVTATGTAPTYQWQYSPDNAAWSNVANNTPANFNYAGSTLSTLTVNTAPITVAGTYYYRCIVSVGGCSSVTSASATFTLNVNSTISLSSAASSDAQTVCTNGAIANISYAIGGGGTGAAISAGAFPTGVTGAFSAGVYTITGTPSVPGTFNYTITTTGPCTQASKSGTITVSALPVGTLIATETSGVANNDSTICAGATVNFTATAGFSLYKFYKTDITNVTTVVQNTSASNIYSSSTINNGDVISVQVFNSLSCATYFNTKKITVTPVPAPTLVADKMTICTGDLVTFTGSGGSNYNFRINGSSQQSGASNTFTSNTLAQGDIVTVDATNANNCTGTSNAITMTVNPIPNGSMTSTATTVCPGVNITFTATGGISYQFRINGVIAQAYSASNTFTSNSIPDASVVTVDVANGASGTGCSTTYFPGIPVTINPPPTGSITATENSGVANDNKICLGAPVTFTFSPTGYSTYNFKINGVSKQSTNSNIFITTELANTSDVVTADVTSGGGCTVTNFTAPAITIAPSPAGTLTASKNPGCAGDNVTFTATTDPTYINYNFKVNGGSSVQNGAGNTYTSTALVNGDVVTVDVTNSNGCISTFTAPAMIVNPLPTGTFTIAETSGTTNNDGIICAGASVTFTVPGTFAGYNFIVNGVSQQNSASNTWTTSSFAGGEIVKVAVTTASGCIGFLTNSFTITVNPLPVVAAITGPGKVCISSSITLSDATTSGVWTSLNTGIATVDAVTGAVTGVASGTATIDYTFTNTNGCSTTVSTIVTVNTPPVVAPVTGNQNICIGTTSQFTDVTPAGSWSSSNSSVASVDAVTGLVTGQTLGSASIMYSVTDVNGCTTVSSISVTVNNFPVVAAIAPASSNICVGGTTTLTDATPGGVWSSSDATVATINASGMVSGLKNGTVTITYSITPTCGSPVSVSATVTVNDPPSATISYAGGPFCTSASPVAVIQTGTTGGIYSYTGSGTLTLAADGTLTPSTSTGGTYTVIYTIAASGGCGVFTTTATVIITTAPSATIAYSGSPYCSNGGTASVTQTGTPGGTYTKTAGAGTLSLNSFTGAISLGTSTPGVYTVTYTILASGGCAQFTTTASVTINAAPVATISYGALPYCSNSGTASVTQTGTTGGTYAKTAGAGTLSLNSSTGAITLATSAPGTYTVTYSVVASGGCTIYTTTASVIINPLPTATITGTAATCLNASPQPVVTFTGANATAPYIFTYNINGGTNTTVTSTGNVATVTAPTTTAGTFTYNLVSVKDASTTACTQNQSGSAIITVNALPSTFTLTPGDTSICLGTVLPLSASVGALTLGSKSASGTSFTIPDANVFGGNGSASNNAVIAGIPAGAVINSISVSFNITHPYDQDLELNIKAPNGNVLNLVYQKGGSGDNFNATINNTSLVPISGTGPITGTFAPDAVSGVGLPNVSNVNAFASLFSVPNGNWVFGAEDDTYRLFGSGNGTGTVNSWSITINYAILPTPVNVVWTPVTNLYTDAAATTAYVASTQLATVYAKPLANIAYTATSSNASNCTASKTVNVTVNPIPTVTITADYCTAGSGKVRLTANSTAGNYIWSTGETTKSIDVNVSGQYVVSVSVIPGSCPGKASINVATELVTNGDFTNGNNGFTSDYAYKLDQPGLVPPMQGELYDDGGTNAYSISTNGQNVHINFWGQDHTKNTTGARNFMLVNGHGNVLVVWKQTANVLPNTTYYFSAWEMSLNSAGNYANLSFNVNGINVGTTSALAAHGESLTAPDNWVQFYGTWNSGPTTTTANISIVDLQASTLGNDFGLDDISFATLSTFISLESAPGTDAQVICKNTPLTDIVYNVGNGSASGPTISALPTGVTSVFAGDKFTISGTPTVAGNYTYTITTTGCNPTTVTGTITVQQQKITLSSGSANPSVCVNTPATIGYTLSGTATGAAVTGLTGATGTVSGSVFTVNWTPTTAGLYPYTVITSGTGCIPDTVRGTITVTTQTITLTSAAATNAQTVCINTPITNIQYTIGGTGTGASIAWSPSAPAGITTSFASGIFIIKGTPATAAGSPYTYTVTSTGTCAGVTATGTLTVTPAASLTLTSGSGSDAQTVCNNGTFTSITYAVNNGTGASIISGALPAGVSGSFSAGVFTISGSPAVGGTFSYTVGTSGGCSTGNASGTITVTAQSITLTSGSASPSICLSAPMPVIVYTIGGTASGAVATGLPAGITGTLSGNVFTISGSTTAPAGPYPYTVTTSGTCGTTTANGTITVSSTAIGGTLASISSCTVTTGTLTLAGNTGNVVRWESSTNGGTSWSPIPNTTISQGYTIIPSGTMYRVVVNNGCTDVYSSIAFVGIHNYWTGNTSTDWNVASNWSDNQLPSTSCPLVHIPNTPNKPILGSSTATITNLQIDAGASLTVNGTGTLQIAGTIANSGTFDVSNGVVELNGTTAQTIPATAFTGNLVKDLIISNNVSLSGPESITGNLSFGSTGKAFATNDNLTLKSSITGTASVDKILSGNTISGNVTVERYIATGTEHVKSWQLLAIPTSGPTIPTGQTIKQSWQEGATAALNTLNGNTVATNPKPGYGTMLTSDVAGAATQPVPGFDLLTTPGPSIKVYNSLTNGYDGPLSTAIPIYNQKGYFILVRGDRSVYTAGGTAVPTVLRTTGQLFTPAHPAPSSSVITGQFTSVGNPYASSIDLSTLPFGTGINTTVTVWDPTIGGTLNGLGAFQTLYLNGGNYVNLLTSAAYGTAGTIHNSIQSGQAFLIGAVGTGGTLTFSESNKISGSNPLLLRPQSPAPGTQAQLRTNLYGINASGTYLADGTLIQYSDAFSDSVNGMDARKMGNTGENLSIKSGGVLLVIERRHTITAEDTIFLNLTGVRVQAYHFEFIASDINTGLQAFLEDNYLHTRTPVSLGGTTVANFSIENIAGSYAHDRFRIVFAPSAVLPVTFTSVKAYLQDKNINVEWRVENEVNMKQYEVEKSINGTVFTTLVVKPATANGGRSAIYVTTDANPVEGYNYYRIKSVDINGKTAYTNIVKVLVGSIKQDIVIVPNPITDGMIHLQLINQPAGRYGLRLLNKLGQIIVSRQINRAEGTSTELIKWNFNLAHGMYNLEVTKPDGSVKNINVLY